MVYRNVENEMLSEKPIYINFEGDITRREELIALCSQIGLNHKRYVTIVNSGNSQNSPVLVEEFQLEEIFSDDWQTVFEENVEREIIVVFTQDGKIPLKVKEQLRLLYGSFRMFTMKCKKASNCKKTFGVTELPIVKHFKIQDDLEGRLANTVTYTFDTENLAQKLAEKFKPKYLGALREQDYSTLLTEALNNQGVIVLDLSLKSESISKNTRIISTEKDLPHKAKIFNIPMPSNEFMNKYELEDFPIVLIQYYDSMNKLQTIQVKEDMPYITFKNIVVNLAKGLESDTKRFKKGKVKKAHIKCIDCLQKCLNAQDRYCLIVGLDGTENREANFQFNVANSDLIRLIDGSNTPVKEYHWIDSSCTNQFSTLIGAKANSNYIFLYDNQEKKSYLKETQVNPMIVNKLLDALASNKIIEMNNLNIDPTSVESLDCQSTSERKAEETPKEEKSTSSETTTEKDEL